MLYVYVYTHGRAPRACEGGYPARTPPTRASLRLWASWRAKSRKGGTDFRADSDPLLHERDTGSVASEIPAVSRARYRQCRAEERALQGAHDRKTRSYGPLITALQAYVDSGWNAEILPWVAGAQGMVRVDLPTPALESFEIPKRKWTGIVEATVRAWVEERAHTNRIRPSTASQNSSFDSDGPKPSYSSHENLVCPSPRPVRAAPLIRMTRNHRHVLLMRTSGVWAVSARSQETVETSGPAANQMKANRWRPRTAALAPPYNGDQRPVPVSSATPFLCVMPTLPGSCVLRETLSARVCSDLRNHACLYAAVCVVSV